MTAVFEVPAYVLANAELRARANEPRPCGEGIGGGRTCGALPARLYPGGYRCGTHDPANRPSPIEHVKPCPLLVVGTDTIGRPIRANPLRCSLALRTVQVETGCWHWTGKISSTGYGNTGHRDAVSVLAHRTVYTLLVGPIPDGLQIDHLCRVRRCVNPEHLEPVTPKENSQRGLSGGMVTHCPAGHAYSEFGYLKGKGWRNCRECDRIRNRKHNWRQIPCTCPRGQCRECRAKRAAAAAADPSTLAALQARRDAGDTA